MMVSAGFTAALEGKKLPSTTYKLLTSCARQFRSSTDVFGSSPKRIVPFATGNANLPVLTHTLSPTMNEYIKAFGTGLVAVSFTYGGYQQTINFGAEVHRPNRNIPRGIFLGIFTIIALYLTINYAYVKVIGFDTLKNSKNIAAIMASKIFGTNAERVLSTFLFLSVLAYVNVLLMSNPRVMYAMSEDRILPQSFQQGQIGVCQVQYIFIDWLGVVEMPMGGDQRARVTRVQSPVNRRRTVG